MPYQITCAALEQQIVFDKNVFTNKTGRKIDMAIIVKDGIQSVCVLEFVILNTIYNK